MTEWSSVIALGLVCWISTTILVESELCRPLREWVDARRVKPVGPPVLGRARRVWWADKLAYLVGCHLCTGTWVAFALVAFFGSPWAEWYGFIAGALLVKAVAHLVLELRPQAWR